MNVRELQHLAAAMAHEVRNPLNSMAIHIELLEGKLRRDSLSPADKESAHRSLAVLQQEIERVDKILEEYLEHAGPAEAARAPVDAARLIADAVMRIKPVAEKLGVGIEVRAGGELGQWAVDAEALGEAIDAILLNAVQASTGGQVVEIAARTFDEQAEVVVSDRGQGIAPDDLKRIFHIGFSGRGLDGLGLTVAKQIVKGHGGSIVCQSPGAGQGATVTVRMPLEAEADDADFGDEDDD
jgi:signal transduction histidine kinase